jgi:hypothetical protein
MSDVKTQVQTIRTTIRTSDLSVYEVEQIVLLWVKDQLGYKRPEIQLTTSQGEPSGCLIYEKTEEVLP